VWIQVVCLVELLHLDNNGPLENNGQLHQPLTVAWTAAGSEPMSRTDRPAVMEPQIPAHPAHNKMAT